MQFAGYSISFGQTLDTAFRLQLKAPRQIVPHFAIQK